jgi:hypothetical protein
MLLLLAALSAGRRGRILDDDAETNSSATPGASQTIDSLAIPREVTLIVLVALFVFGVAIIVGLCCIKRARIGKAQDLSTQRFESLEDLRGYTEALPVTQEYGPLIHAGPFGPLDGRA